MLRRAVIAAVLALPLWAQAQQEPPQSPTVAAKVHDAVELPVEVACGQGLFISARLNGKGPYWMMVDSGGGSSYLLDSAVAQKLGLEPRRRFRLSGAGETQPEAYSADGPEIALAKGVSMKPESVVVTDFSELSKRCHRNVDGLLGYDFFRRYTVELDYQARHMVLHPTEFEYTGSGDRLPLRISRSNMMSVPVNLSLDDNAPTEVRMLVDTGDAKVPVAFTRDFVEEKGLLSKLEHDADLAPANQRSLGLGGHTSYIIATLPAMDIGNFRFRDLRVALSQDDGGALAGGSYDGVLGAGILSKFRLIFDLPHQQLIVEPNFEEAQVRTKGE